MKSMFRSLFFGIILLPWIVSPVRAGSFLFDYTKDETAGNADWIVDDDWPVPQPPNPTQEDDWLGALSSWGVALAQMGHQVRTLPPGHPITFGNAQDSLDLMYFDVFVICEPQAPFSPQEIQAVVQFVEQGGGLFLIANHYASDRNGNGWDAPRIFNAAGFDTLFGIHFHVAGEPHNNLWDAPDSNVTMDPDDPIVHGPLGDVGAIGYYAGTVMSLWTFWNPEVRGHVWATGSPHGTTDVTLASSQYGFGRIVGLGDSSPADDGTGTPGNNLYDGWHAPGEDNDIAILNACLWLLGQSGNHPPYILDIQQVPLFPTPLDTVLVSARITDDSGILVAKLFYSVSSAPWWEVFPDSTTGEWWYFHIPPADSGLEVSYFLWAQDDSQATTVSDTLSYWVTGSGGLDLTGFRLIQENSHREFVFDTVTIPPAGFVILARNATRSQFESFWGVSLPEQVIFVNSHGQFPVINGDEIFTLVNVQGDTLDGPTVPMSTGISLQRSQTGPANDPSVWITLPDSQATPGSLNGLVADPGLWITEISDASGAGNYVYEFIELYYSPTVGTSEGAGSFSPIRVIPNPAQQVVQLKGLTKETWIQLFDASGRLRLQLLVSPSRAWISLRDFPPGVYFLKSPYGSLPILKMP